MIFLLMNSFQFNCIPVHKYLCKKKRVLLMIARLFLHPAADVSMLGIVDVGCARLSS